MGNSRRTALLAAAAVALALSISLVYANVFAYYPVTVNVNPTSAPVYFAPGSNAGKPDLGSGNTIAVTPGSNGASVTVTIHPTYRTTYYKNVTIVVNTDSKAYYVYFRVVTPASLPSGSTAQLCIYGPNVVRTLTGFPNPTPGGYLQCVNLLSTGTTGPVTLGANSRLELDLWTYIPEGTTLPTSTTVQVQLIYTPTQEQPP